MLIGSNGAKSEIVLDNEQLRIGSICQQRKTLCSVNAKNDKLNTKVNDTQEYY